MKVTKEQFSRRAYWLTGHGALKSMFRTVELVSAGISKHESVDRDATMRNLHARLSPVYRTVRRLMRQAISDLDVKRDPELEKLRREIDPSDDPYAYHNEEPADGPSAPGVQQPLDEQPFDHAGNPTTPKKPAWWEMHQAKGSLIDGVRRPSTKTTKQARIL